VSQRNSGYARVPGEKYFTPPWVVACLLPHIPPTVSEIFDPACGEGAIVKALSGPFVARGKDLDQGYDFLKDGARYEAIVANPPFNMAEPFIEHSLRRADFVAMLLRTDYAHARTRAHLFHGHPRFAKKVELLKRIVWFERKGAAPSFNHSWFIWDSGHRGPPTLVYSHPEFPQGGCSEPEGGRD
jgi:hypothetical protein